VTEHQRLFLLQARSDFDVFEFLREHCRKGDFPACHALHYLQMATELLGKAHAWKRGPPRQTHRAFVRFLRGAISVGAGMTRVMAPAELAPPSRLSRRLCPSERLRRSDGRTRPWRIALANHCPIHGAVRGRHAGDDEITLVEGGTK
jgi:hypothetical protein